MVVYETLIYSREGLALGIFIILFAGVNYAMNRFSRGGGSAVVTALIVAIIGAWQMYRSEFYGWEETLRVLLGIALVLLALKMIWSFLKFIGGTANKSYSNIR